MGKQERKVWIIKGLYLYAKNQQKGKLKVQMVGLEPQEQTVTVEATATDNFTLKESAAEIQDVVVTAQRERCSATDPSGSLMQFDFILP